MDDARSRDGGLRPAGLGQASEHLTPGSLGRGSRRGRRLSPGAAAGEGARARRPGRLPRRTCGSAPPPASPGSGVAAAPAGKPPSQKAASSLLPWLGEENCPRVTGCNWQSARTQFPSASRRPASALIQGVVTARVFKPLSRKDEIPRDFHVRRDPEAQRDLTITPPPT